MGVVYSTFQTQFHFLDFLSMGTLAPPGQQQHYFIDLQQFTYIFYPSIQIGIKIDISW